MSRRFFSFPGVSVECLLYLGYSFAPRMLSAVNAQLLVVIIYFFKITNAFGGPKSFNIPFCRDISYIVFLYR